MKKLMMILSLLFAFSVFAQVDFELEGYPSNIKLKDLRGKFVVLEWFNEGCPFVRKFYDVKKMQELQKKYKSSLVWLTINSSAKDKQGYIADKKSAKKTFDKEAMFSHSLLIDSNGKVGKDFGAKTTPHMFLINPKGKVIYQGAIDSIASTDSNDIKNAKNYISLAIDDALAGKKVKFAKTKAYGCSVKY